MPRVTSKTSSTPATRGGLRTPSASPRKLPRNGSRSLEDDTVPVAPSAAQLLNQSQQTTEEWYKAVRTKKGYAGYVKGGKVWLQEQWSKPTLDVSGSNSSESIPELDDEEIELHSQLEKAFDSISEHTATALRIFTTYKCDHKGLGFSTAEGIRSAFKDYFER